jgi:glucosamine--fructose-6-phosphate aminotransferase (isomerizing)
LTKGVELKSETDTEVVVQLVGWYYSQGASFKEAVTKTLNNHIVGSYALLFINKDHPDRLIAARNGSPLLIGTGKDFFIVSSDAAAFQKYTNNYFLVDNQDIIELTTDMKITESKIQQASVEQIYLKPKEGYDHFMLQEIMEQPDTCNRAMNYGSRFVQISHQFYAVKLGGLEIYSDFLKNAKNLLIVACGTSYFASMYVCNLMRKLDIFNTIQLVDGAEFTIDHIPKENPIMIFVSQSGETFDVLKPVIYMFKF